jgi:hypothetical protein
VKQDTSSNVKHHATEFLESLSGLQPRQVDKRRINQSLEGRDGSRKFWFRADSHYTSRFRSVAERHRSVKFSHVYLNGDVHTERNVSVTSQFRSVAERECLTWWNGSEPVWTCSILIMWTILRLLHYTSVLACNECCLFFLQKMALKMNLGYNETAFVLQTLLQPGRQNLRNWIRHTSSNMPTYYRQFPSELNM